MERWSEKGKMVKVLLKALLISYAVTAVILLALAFVMLKLQPDAQKTGIVILISYVLSCLTGGWLCGKKAGQKRFLWGLLTGTAYFILLFLVSGIGERTLPMELMHVLTAFVLCAGSGMAGGMIAS